MKKSVSTLKTYFETNDVPTQQQFWDWLDSFIHKDEGKVITATENVPEGFKITYSDASEDLIPTYELENQNISFITGLQTFIDGVNSFMSGHILTDNNFTNQNLQDLTDLLALFDDVVILPAVLTTEDLTGAKRKGDFLFNILDVHTGEAVYLSKLAEAPAFPVDNILYFQLGSEYFKRLYSGFANIKWFGVKGDTVYNEGTDTWDGTDDTEALELAVASNVSLFAPEGVYKLVSGSLTEPTEDAFRGLRLSSGQSIQGVEGKSHFVMTGIVNGTPATYFNGFNGINAQDITIKDIKITGELRAYEELLTFDYASAGLHFFGASVKNIKVENCECSYILGHGIQDNSENSFNVYKNNIASFNSQNGINANGNFVKLLNNYGRENGFGLIEASCGNSLISGNVAEFNLNSGIAIGGYNAEFTNGHGNNNIIVNNTCNNNVLKGLNITIGVVDSIISNNTCFKNGQFGIILTETFDKISNNLITGNTVFDNGLEGGTGKMGIFVSSKGNTLSNNNIYNTEAAALTLDKQNYGIVIEFGKHGNVITGNQYKSIGTYDLYISAGTLNTTIQENEKTNIFIETGCTLTTEDKKSIISYNGYPITIEEKFIGADNPSSSKIAILPPAAIYPEGRIMRIIDFKGTAATHNITIAPTAGEKVNGIVDDTVDITTNYGNIKLISDGIDNWIILN